MKKAADSLNLTYQGQICLELPWCALYQWRGPVEASRRVGSPEQSKGESQEAAHHPRARQGWGRAQVLTAEASLGRKHGRPLEDVAFHSGLHVHSYFSIQLTCVGTQALTPQHSGSRGTNSKLRCSSVRRQSVLRLLLQCRTPNALWLNVLRLTTFLTILAEAGEGPP